MTTKTAAIRYARALFDVALHERIDLDRAEQDLVEIHNLFTREPALEHAMLNPAVPVPRKRAAMVEITALAQTLPVVSKLLILLAERDRLIVLSDLLAAFRARVLDYRKVVRAEVTTVAPLAANHAQEIQRRLSQVTGKTVLLESRVDPAIIGGLVAKVGSTVYDASVANQLRKMRDRLAESV